MLKKKLKRQPKLILPAQKRKPQTIRLKKTISFLFAPTVVGYKFKRLLAGVFNNPAAVVFLSPKLAFPKGLFHIKCLFDLEEFATYDYFNFQKANGSYQKVLQPHSIANEPIRFNFFYRIRTAIKIFRTHTLMFFEHSYNTEHRTNLFFKTFSTMSTLAYMWFFEFNLGVFLVKVNFCKSFQSGLMFLASDICTINGNNSHSR